MTHQAIDRCKEATITTGTGTLTLTGPAAGCVSVASGLTADGDTSWFCAENGTEWEVFLGTRVDSTHLARTTVIASSNAGAPVSFAAPPVVFSTVPASKISAVGPSVSAYRATSNQAISASTVVTVQLNGEAFDTGNCLDAATYKWTPTVAGYYMVAYSVNVGATSGITTALAYIYKNNIAEALASYVPTGATTDVISAGAKLIYMNGVSDFLELRVYSNGVSPYVRAGIEKTFFTAYLAALPGPPMLAPPATVGPAFRATLSADQTGIVSATFTRVNLNTKEFDTDTCYDNTTNYRFTPNVPGYYMFSWLILASCSSLTAISAQIRKNGANVGDSVFIPISSPAQRTVGTRLIYMNGTTDYVELWGYLTGTGLKFVASAADTSFSGHFVRG